MFTQEQLEAIKFAAKRTKNQGEVAVFNKLLEQQKDKATHWPYTAFFNETQFTIIEFCANECKRQRSGEMSVYDMCVAWDFAHFISYEPILIGTIEEIGKKVEPIDNRNGFRKIGVQVGGNVKPHYSEVPRLLEHLLASYYEGLLEPMEGYYIGLSEKSQSAEDEFYYQYENIHPFADGNGRSGKILYNYLKGTLDNPVMPPNYWGSSNP